jgi:hypothetical protein
MRDTSPAWATIRAPGPAPQLGHAADMVGMPVRQQDRVHLADSMPGLLDCSHHLVGPAGQSGINQHDAVVDDNRIGVDICDRDLDDSVDHFAHAVILPTSAELVEAGLSTGFGRIDPARRISTFRPLVVSNGRSSSQFITDQWSDLGTEKFDRAHRECMINMSNMHLKTLNTH